MKKIKNILFALIFSLVIGCQVTVSSAASLSELKGGIYTIKNDVSYENETGIAMARSYLNENMTLEKSNGSWYYTIKFSGLQYMSDHAIYVNGSKVSHTVKSKSTSADTIELKFKTKSIKPNLKVSMYVSAMGRSVKFGVIPKESTLKLVKVTEKPKTESSANKNNSTTNKTESSTNKNNSSTNKTESSTNKSNTTSNNNNSSSKDNNNSNKTDKKSNSTVKEESKSEKTEKESDKSDKKEEITEDNNKEESDKEEVTKEEVVEERNEEVVSEESEEKPSNKLMIIGAGAVVIAIIALVLRKIKK